MRALICPTAPLRAKAGDLFKSGPVLVAGRKKIMILISGPKSSLELKIV